MAVKKIMPLYCNKEFLGDYLVKKTIFFEKSPVLNMDR